MPTRRGAAVFSTSGIFHLVSSLGLGCGRVLRQYRCIPDVCEALPKAGRAEHLAHGHTPMSVQPLDRKGRYIGKSCRAGP